MVRSKATAKPQSALNNMIAVKRVIRRGGIQSVDTPNTNIILKGLLRQYVHLHGAEVLCPKRAEPLVASDMRGILSVGPETKCGSDVVDWDLPPFSLVPRVSLNVSFGGNTQSGPVVPALWQLHQG